MQVDKARLDEMLDLSEAVNIGARAIYADGPSIGQDTEDGYDAQSEGYKHKARAIAHVVLMATAARPELRSLRSTEGKPVAWMHTLTGLDGAKDTEVNTSPDHPFGRVGRDYTEVCTVKSVPLYATPDAAEAHVAKHFDTLDSCLESLWCLTTEGSDDRILADQAIASAKYIRASVLTAALTRSPE